MIQGWNEGDSLHPEVEELIHRFIRRREVTRAADRLSHGLPGQMIVQWLAEERLQCKNNQLFFDHQP